jgi:hypothetical protein
MEIKVACSSCGSLILESTFKKNNGLCCPCLKIKDNKPTKIYRKMKAKEAKIVIPISVLLIILAIYYEKIPGRNGHLTPSETPYFFWGAIIFAIVMVVKEVDRLFNKNNDGDSDT